MAIRLESANTEWLSAAAAPNSNNDYSVFFRIRRYTITTRQTLFYIDAGTGDLATDWLYLQEDNGEPDRIVFIRYDNAGNVDVQGSSNPTAYTSTTTDYGIWLVRSSAAYSFYLDGNASAVFTTAAGLATVTTSTRLAFGAGTPGWDPSDIAISDMAIWTEAVSNTNRATVFTNGAAAYTTNQWGRWSGEVHTVLTDLTGNGRNLTANGTLSTVTDPVVPSGGGGGSSPVYDGQKWPRGTRLALPSELIGQLYPRSV